MLVLVAYVNHPPIWRKDYELLPHWIATATTVTDAGSLLQGAGVILNYGVVGVFLILFFTRKIRPGADYDDEKAAREAQDKWMKEELIPLVSDVVAALKSSTELLNNLKQERDHYIRRLEDTDRERRK